MDLSIKRIKKKRVNPIKSNDVNNFYRFQIEIAKPRISTPNVIEKYLKYEIDEIHSPYVRMRSLDLPFIHWDDGSNGWNRVARSRAISRHKEGGGVAPSLFGAAIGQTRVLGKKEKKERRGEKKKGRNRLWRWQPPWNPSLRHLPSTPPLKLLRSARDDRCLVSSFAPLGSGNRSCLASVSPVETIFLAAIPLLFFKR